MCTHILSLLYRIRCRCGDIRNAEEVCLRRQKLGESYRWAGDALTDLKKNGW